MATAIPKDMTADEFLIWNLSQDQRYELVDGMPLPLRAMSGASNYRDDIVTNLIAALRQKLRSTGCKPRTADTALRTAIKRVRRPDVTVDCGESRADSYESAKPTAVFEVLSPSTRKIDGSVKLSEYLRHPTLRTIVHIDPDRMDVAVFQRDDAGQWSESILVSPTDRILVAGTPADLTLAEIYEGIPVS
jgi:Uma2 family endonuclease